METKGVEMGKNCWHCKDDYSWSRRRKDKEFVREELDDYMESRNVSIKKTNTS
jgi:hypothetical protein